MLFRSDGTRVYFFDQEELGNIWTGKSLPPLEAVTSSEEVPVPDVQGRQDQEQLFDIEELGVDRRLLVNRAKKLKMYRCWMQGRFRKK